MQNCAVCFAGDVALLPLAKASLQNLHSCGVLVNDLHPKHVVKLDDSTVQVFFNDFSHARLTRPSIAQCEDEVDSLCRMLSALT